MAMGKDWLKERKKAVELVGTIVLIMVLIWQYGDRAPRAIIVLSFLLSIALVLVQLPFLAGFYGRRHFKPALVVFIVVLPFLISLGYRSVYNKDLMALLAEEWLGAGQSAISVIAVVALPVLSFLAGHLSRKYRR